MTETSVSVLVSSLTALAEKVERIVQVTREDFETTADFYQFVLFRTSFDQGIVKIGGVVFPYAECMKSVGVKTKAELEQLWTKHYSEPGVKTAVESVLQAEQHCIQWNLSITVTVGTIPRVSSIGFCLWGKSTLN